MCQGTFFFTCLLLKNVKKRRYSAKNRYKARKITKNHDTYFGLDSTRGQYYNVYIPTGDAQKEKYHVRRPAGTGKMTEKETLCVTGGALWQNYPLRLQMTTDRL